MVASVTAAAYSNMLVWVSSAVGLSPSIDIVGPIEGYVATLCQRWVTTTVVISVSMLSVYSRLEGWRWRLVILELIVLGWGTVVGSMVAPVVSK